MVPLDAVLDLTTMLRRNPRDTEVRQVLHDALLERYPDTYEWAIELARHDLTDRSGKYRNRAARVSLLPSQLILAESALRNAASDQDVQRAQHFLASAFDVVLLYSMDGGYLGGRGLGRWGRKLQPDEIVVYEVHRNQLASAARRP